MEAPMVSAHTCPKSIRVEVVMPDRNGHTPIRVLVVDDHPDAAASLAMLLRFWGYDTRTSHTGPDAVRLAGEFLPQIVLLDIGLPQMDGYQVARVLRTHSQLKRSLLVAITGFVQEADRRRCEDAGFDLYLPKPVESEQLRELLREASVAIGN
jgi:CheY-like chemotaxis protein